MGYDPRRRRPLSLLLTFALVPLVAGACSTFSTDPEASGPTPTADAAAAPDTTDPVKGTADRGLTITVGDPKATAFVIQNGSLDLPIKLTRRDSTTGDVLVTVKGLPPEVTAESVTIPAGKTEGTLTLLAKATSVQGGPTIADITATEQGPLGTGASAKLSTFVRGARGGLDTTFGDKGAARMYGLGSEANAFDAKTLRNGSILVAARARNNLVLSRFTSSGVIDSSFAGGGTSIVLTSQGFPAFDVVEPASPATGWIYFLQAAGSSMPRIVRLNLDGVGDTKFNGNGEVVLSDPGAAGSVLVPLQIIALADGKALISHQRAGTTTMFVSRWNPDGTRDETYGTGGTCAGAGGKMLLRAGGAVFLTGGAGMRGCTANGVLDQSIGVAPDYTAVAGAGGAVDIARTPSGGVAFLNVRAGSNVLNRLTQTLEKDGSIGLLGDLLTPLGQATSNLSSTFVVQEDGGVLIGTPAIGNLQSDTIGVLRYTAKGVIDTSFGAGGTATFTIGMGAELTKLVAQPDGRILALGKSEAGFDAAMVRFWP